MHLMGLIEIKDQTKQTRTLKGRSGSEFQIHEQDGFIQAGDEYRKIAIRLDDGQAPYPAGRYQTKTPVEVGQYGDIQTPRKLVLMPAK